MLFCMEYLKFALRLIWKKFSIRFYIENKEIFLTTLYGKPKPHKKVIFKALLRLLHLSLKGLLYELKFYYCPYYND